MRHPALGVFSQVIVAALLAAGAAAVAPRQPSQTTPQDPQRPTFRTEANFVRVDVYPTSGGKPLLDLRKEEFEVLEDGRPQAIETFEHVRISAGGPQSERADPGSIEAMRQAAANPRSRIFVIFLDAPHVTADGARNIGQALDPVPRSLARARRSRRRHDALDVSGRRGPRAKDPRHRERAARRVLGPAVHDGRGPARANLQVVLPGPAAGARAGQVRLRSREDPHGQTARSPQPRSAARSRAVFAGRPGRAKGHHRGHRGLGVVPAG